MPDLIVTDYGVIPVPLSMRPLPRMLPSEEGERRAMFRAWLEAFIEGCELTVSEDPDRKPRDTMLARVHPVQSEFWSIRVTDPEDTPGIRAFGGFAQTDDFVALIWEKREVIGDEFNEEVDAVRDAWHDYFGDHPPHRGDTLNEYLTINLAV